MKRFVVTVGICLAILFLLDQVYFKQYRSGFNYGVVNETFVRGGTLGRLLKKAGLIEISEESYIPAILDYCAEREELRGFDSYNQFRLRAYIYTPSATELTLKVAVGQRGNQVKYHRSMKADSGTKFYNLNFEAKKGEEVYVRYSVSPAAQGTLIDAFIDGRFQRSQQIIKQGLPVDSVFNSINNEVGATSKTGVATIMMGRVPEVTQYIPNGIDSALYQGTLPGKKNKGYCTYVAKQYSTNTETAMLSPGRPLLLPKVTIRMEEENLYGEQGILDNKDQHGRNWEKPAVLNVINDKPIYEQKISMRYHGGTPGRRKDIESFRLYARSRFGRSHIDAESILGRPGQLDFRTLVLKYTYQVLQDTPVDFNPFVHSFALDIGNNVNAIVPRHALVDLTINDAHKGLYLAMEHPAERTIADWLGHEDFVLYKYKSQNTDYESYPLFSVAYEILKKRDEETLQELKKHLAIDNVVNSILLTAYIGDDDSCQGVEIISQNEETTEITVTNWDLDHSFFTATDGEIRVDPAKYSLHLLRPDKKTPCIRQWMFGWTYLQSGRFRSLVKERLEELLATSLNPEQLGQRLNYYREVNQHELGGRYDQAIEDLEMFIQKRPAALRRQFAKLDQRIALIDQASVQW